MGFLGKLVEATVNTVLTPVDVVKDIATMGGVFTDEEKPYTLQRLEKVVKNIEESGEDAGEGDWL